jgi:hypothetical protein
MVSDSGTYPRSMAEALQWLPDVNVGIGPEIQGQGDNQSAYRGLDPNSPWYAYLSSAEGLGPGGMNYIPSFDKGGTIPGPIGAPQLVIAHGGETVTPAGKGGGIVIQGPLMDHVTISSNVDVDLLNQQLGFALESAYRRAVSN